MRTTLDLPEELIAEAMDLTKAKTKTAVITQALEGLIRKEKIAELKDFKAKVDIDIDLTTLRARS